MRFPVKLQVILCIVTTNVSAQYHYGGFKCGDKDTLGVCKCGDTSITHKDFIGKRMFCCPSLGCSKYGNFKVYCENATVMNWSAQCNGRCLDDEIHHSYNCSSEGPCVYEGESCKGYEDLCVHNSDHCSEKNKCEGWGWEKCKTLHGTSMCFESFRKTNDGEFDCLSREDEDLPVETKESVPYSELKECFSEYGTAGLECNGTCLSNFEWCNDELQTICKTKTANLFTTNKILCSNAKFWMNKTCIDGDYSYGKRCSGSLHHCIYPPYLDKDYSSDFSLKKTCSDNSDKIFTVNSTCRDIEAQKATIYCRTFCQPGSELKGSRCSDVCADPKAWIRKQTDPDIIDSHDCTSSCTEPNPDCLACTHPDFNFTCTVDKKLSCLHKDLVCDSHPQCDQAEDELLDNCLDTLLRRKLVSEDATVRCYGKMYKNVETMAKACDGSVECEDSADEWWLCTDNKIIIYIVFAICFAILIVWIILKCRKQRNKLSAGPIQQEPGKAKEDMAVLLTKRDEKDFWLKVNFQVLRNQFLEDEDERAETNKMLYDDEDSRQGFNVSKTKYPLPPADSLHHEVQTTRLK